MVDDSAGPITGVVFNVVLGIFAANVSNAGAYTTTPSNPASQSATSGSGVGATVNISYSSLAVATDGAGGLPLQVYGTAISNVTGMLTGVLKPVSTPPWTITVGVAGITAATNTILFCPIILYDSTTHRAVAVTWIEWGGNSNFPAAYVTYYHDTRNPHGTVDIGVVNATYIASGYFIWFRVVNDGTNLTFYVSSENVTYLDLFSISATALTTSFDFVGFGIDRNANSGDQLATVLWNWVQS
jgi:hypothetical protein